MLDDLVEGGGAVGAAQGEGEECALGGDMTDTTPHLRLQTMRALDGRTTAAKNARRIARELAAFLGDGPLTPTQADAIQQAAVLSVIGGDLESRRLAGEAISLEDLVRVRRLQRQLVRDLGIPDKPPEAPLTPTPTGEFATDAIDRALAEHQANGGS